ncbi:MAG TPA: plastocyanin/azurin family copper-binding protein [Solirubrobacteraceae bacterium]|jgi:plastocyanin
MLKRPLRDRRLRLLIALTVVLAAVSSVALASTKTALIKDNFFTPKTLTINKGSKVTWQWKGSLFHNVTVKSGPVRFHSRNQYRGSYSHTFLRRGTYRLYCSLHPYMKMTVVVR